MSFVDKMEQISMKKADKVNFKFNQANGKILRRIRVDEFDIDSRFDGMLVKYFIEIEMLSNETWLA